MSLPTMHLEAVLFSSAKPISIDMLAEVFGLSTEATQKIYRKNYNENWKNRIEVFEYVYLELVLN